MARFENDLGFVLAGGGDPPEPVALERLQKDFDKEADACAYLLLLLERDLSTRA